MNAKEKANEIMKGSYTVLSKRSIVVLYNGIDKVSISKKAFKELLNNDNRYGSTN